jgi:2'-5' RNA ligase
MAAGSADTARLFFAAWPAPEVQHALHRIGEEAQRVCGGRAIQERNIHLTLVFLGNVERVRLPQLKAIAAGIVAAPCDLTFDRVEYWRHNRILWAGVACAQLGSSLTAARTYRTSRCCVTPGARLRDPG